MIANKHWTVIDAPILTGPFDRSIDHEDQYSRSRVWIGMFLNGMAGLPGIPIPGKSVSSQLAADIRLLRPALPINGGLSTEARIR
jgi:hypothetical protein